MKFHRGSTWVKSLGTNWKRLNKKAGLPFTDVNKWNPADIWLIGSDTVSNEFLESEAMEELNAKIKEAFKDKDVYGVSLKLMMGATHVDTVNYRPNQVVPKFKEKTVGKVNFYRSKDVYLKYESGEIQFRGFGGKVDSWQGELGGAHSKLGKIGRGSINTVLRKLALKPGKLTKSNSIPEEAKLLKRIKDERADFIENDFFPLAKKEGVETKLATFQKKLQGEKNKKRKSALWLKSKYLGLYLFDIIRDKEKEVVPNFITYASSASELSSTHLKLM